MIQEILDEVLDTSLQPDNNPRYTIKDNDGRIINDNVQIEFKTPVVQNPTPLNKATLSNIQGDLYTQDRYNTPTYSGTAMTLNLPLKSYEKGKIVSITAPANLTNPTLNINKLGAKTVNGKIYKNGLYSLIYNGTSWDIYQPVITGTYTGDSTTNREIALGFTPTSLIVVSVETGAVTFAINNGTRSSGTTGVAIASDKEYAYGQYGSNNEDKGVTIGENKFTINGESTYLSGFNYTKYTYNYIAFK